VRSTDISPISRVMRRVDLATEGTVAGDSTATGFPSVDRWLGGGVRSGDLVVLGGDVGSGKSALALAMALRMAQDGRTARFLTTEMTVDRVMERAVAIEGRAKVDDLRSGKLDDVARSGVGAAAIRLRDAGPVIETAPATVADLVARIREGEKGGVVFVDSLQGLIGATTLPLEEEQANVVRVLKKAALDLGVAIVLVAHLEQRAHDGESDHRPGLADFGAKDAIRHHADVVTAIYREEMYHPGGGVEGGTEFLFLKNRNGTTGYVDLYFYKQWLRFEDMLDPDR
jgi:replicative DNA helicase